MTTIIRGSDSFDTQNPPGLIDVQTKHLNTPFSQTLVANTKTIVNYTGVYITPKSINSKILILVHWCGEVSATEENLIFGLIRNGTHIGNPIDVGTRNNGIMPVAISYHANRSSTLESCAFHYVDSPATTSELKYNLTVTHGTASTLYTNQTVAATDSAAYERGTTGITLLEILI